jgi:hypothetical protein
LLSGPDPRKDREPQKHAGWAEEFRKEYRRSGASDIGVVLERETGLMLGNYWKKRRGV